MAMKNYNIQSAIGLIPAAGEGTRIAPLPGSKELYPIGFRDLEDGSLRPKVVSHYLLEKMRLAGIHKAFFLLRPGKWDIPAYFGAGEIVDMELGYLVVSLPFGVPYTINQAYPFVKDAAIAMGFPDILFQPNDTYKRLLARLNTENADVAINLLPFEQPHKGGMVDFDSQGRVKQIIEKPAQSDLKYSWCAAVWKPSFTQFIHQFVTQLEAERSRHNSAAPREVPFGDVIQAAIDAGLQVEAEICDRQPYLDIGTPADLQQAIQRLTSDL